MQQHASRKMKSPTIPQKIQKLLQRNFASRKQARIFGLDDYSSDWGQTPDIFLPIQSAPLISVVLPVFNHAKYIAASIRSVLSQKIPLELIIVDDGSTDDLHSAISRFLGDKRVKFLRKENGGLSSALNLGFKHASAFFLTWTSADNLYLTDSLLELAKTLIENPSCSLAYGNVELIDESGKVIKNTNYRVSDQTGDQLHLTRESQSLFYYDDNFINSCFLYRRSFASLAGHYSRELNGVEDYQYWLKLSAFSPAIHTTTNRVLYQYRLHPDTLTSTLDGNSLSNLTRTVRTTIKEYREQVDLTPLPNNLRHAVERATLILPPQIARSRDSDFKALPESPGGLNVGIIYRDGEQITLENNSKNSLSVYTLDQNHTSESLGIDGALIFNDHPETFDGVLNEEYRARSLMFYLSRIDFLLLPSLNWQPEELRYKAGLAASAGLELRVLRRNDLTMEELEYLGLFVPAKHVSFYDSLSEACSAELKLNLSRIYFDNWLYSQSFKGISSLVKTGILSKKIEKVFS